MVLTSHLRIVSTVAFCEKAAEPGVKYYLIKTIYVLSIIYPALFHKAYYNISSMFLRMVAAIFSVGTSLASPPKGSSISSAINSRLAST